MGSIYMEERVFVPTPGPWRQRRAAFAASVIDFGNDLEKSGGPFQHVGTWEMVGMTGHGPKVLCLYEYGGGWPTFADMIDQTMEIPSPEVAEVYARTDDDYDGGVDSIYRPLPGCPTTPQLRERGMPHRTLLWQKAYVEPGTEEQYGELLLDYWRTDIGDQERALVGLFENALEPGNVVAYWSVDAMTLETLFEKARATPAAVELGRRRRRLRQEIYHAPEHAPYVHNGQ
jgi:hypothetical protein